MFDQKITRRGLAATAKRRRGRDRIAWLVHPISRRLPGNMERARFDPSSDGVVAQSTANKGGHRARAMELVRQVFAKTQASVEFADNHGDGGR
jgi:hypothetical protein